MIYLPSSYGRHVFFCCSNDYILSNDNQSFKPYPFPPKKILSASELLQTSDNFGALFMKNSSYTGYDRLQTNLIDSACRACYLT